MKFYLNSALLKGNKDWVNSKLILESAEKSAPFEKIKKPCVPDYYLLQTYPQGFKSDELFLSLYKTTVTLKIDKDPINFF